MNQGRKLTIGTAARAVGVSAKAVRLWEAKGLLPRVSRTEAGYRLFTIADLSLLRFIHRVKALGLTLSEIGEIIELQRTGTVPCTRVNALLDAHIAELDRRLTELQQFRQTLRAVRDLGNQRHGAEDAAVCHSIEAADKHQPAA